MENCPTSIGILVKSYNNSSSLPAVPGGVYGFNTHQLPKRSTPKPPRQGYWAPGLSRASTTVRPVRKATDDPTREPTIMSPKSKKGSGSGKPKKDPSAITEHDSKSCPAEPKDTQISHGQGQEKQDKKKKKKRNEHLNQKVNVKGETFEFERAQVEKKAGPHGTDFGLEPARDQYGK